MNAIQDVPSHPDPSIDVNSYKYGAFQNEIYKRGMFGNVKPTVTTDPSKLEQQAKEAMSQRGFNYIAGGAGERSTMEANRLAFRQWKLVPRMLRGAAQRDLSVELFGEKQPNPIIVAPVGVQEIFHEDKDVGVAEVAAELGVTFTMSTAGSSSIEHIGKVGREKGGRQWFQLYWPKSDDVTASLLNRAKREGFKVLVVTLDTWTLGWRPWDLDHAYVPFVKGLGCEVGFSDPAFRKGYGKDPRDPKHVTEASIAWTTDIFDGMGHTWESLKLLKQYWDGPIILKGIQSVDDAKLAVQYGMDGVLVSNHGGRQLDGAVGSLDMLAEIAEAVGDKTTVLFDSGIRTGADVMKALALGAKAVLIGRPVMYGLGIAGKAGAKDVMRYLLADLDQSMGLAGYKNVHELGPHSIRRIQYPGDSHSNY
ncbi:oxidoreductase [Polychaeton citri CBS 116435]|uniref:Oxidoreductase n=1 Tax=Polychaeton citri CBS 116435 TaxID=1314669 RepID=A0A9P4URM4_9PEZI|nr:oxidoreductase [Polychaeton citri CBS 116435]